MEIWQIILIAVCAIIALFIVWINVTAIASAKKRKTSDTPHKNVDEKQQKANALKLKKMIQCQTVYSENCDDAEFKKFREVLKTEFPKLHQKAALTIFGTGCLIYKIEGENPNKNIMLMSHHDVVAGDGEWKHQPFSGDIADGALWGRGTIDTKTPLFAELAAVEELISEGFTFGTNVYIGSSNNEEVCGDGIPLAVEYFKKNNIRFDLVLDEGGAITTGMMPGVSRKSAMVAIHEKGRHTFKCTASTTGAGHQGLIPNKGNGNAISRMSAFIAEVNDAKIFETKFYPEVETTFIRHAPYMAYPFRLLFANFKLLKGLLRKVLPLVNTQVSAMMRTSLYFTSIQGGSGEQIQAKEVVSYAFFRCVREEQLEKEMIKFNKIAQKYGITVEKSIVDYCKPSTYESEYFRKLEKVLNTNFPDVIVAPFLLTAGTDARHFTDIADNILRFAPIDLNRQQFSAIHNKDENIGLENISECVCFYKDYLKEIK